MTNRYRPRRVQASMVKKPAARIVPVLRQEPCGSICRTLQNSFGICYNDTMHRTLYNITLFDRYLEARGLRFDAVVIGGAALNLLGVVSRLTKDCDILFPEIPNEIAKALTKFRAYRPREGWCAHRRMAQ